MNALSPRQAQVLDVIRSYVDAHGFPPTIREIGKMLGMKSSATVAHYLEVLEGKGLIEWQRGKARTIRLREEASGHA